MFNQSQSSPRIKNESQILHKDYIESAATKEGRSLSSIKTNKKNKKLCQLNQQDYFVLSQLNNRQFKPRTYSLRFQTQESAYENVKQTSKQTSLNHQKNYRQYVACFKCTANKNVYINKNFRCIKYLFNKNDYFQKQKQRALINSRRIIQKADIKQAIGSKVIGGFQIGKNIPKQVYQIFFQNQKTDTKIGKIGESTVIQSVNQSMNLTMEQDLMARVKDNIFNRQIQKAFVEQKDKRLTNYLIFNQKHKNYMKNKNFDNNQQIFKPKQKLKKPNSQQLRAHKKISHPQTKQSVNSKSKNKLQYKICSFSDSKNQMADMKQLQTKIRLASDFQIR